LKPKKLKLDIKEKEKLTEFVDCDFLSPAIKKKIRVILLRSEGKTIDYIVNNTMLSKRTIINYTNKYLENNRFFHRKNHKRSVLYTRKDEILKEFRKKPPKSYKEAATRIKELYGIERSATQVRYFLNRNDVYTNRSKKYNPEYKKKINKRNERRRHTKRKGRSPFPKNFYTHKF
jgi:transposase